MRARAAVHRLSTNPQHETTGRQLLREYLELPDGTAGFPSAHLAAWTNRLVDQYPNNATPPGGDVLLADLDKRIVGQVLIVEHEPGVARLERMYVQPDQRGKRVGHCLLDAAILVAEELAYAQIVLDVLATRTEAERFYRSNAFDDIEPYADYPVPMVFLARPTTLP